MNRSFNLLIALFGVVFLFSCAPKTLGEIASTEKLPKKKDKELLEVLDSLSQVKPKTFYSKLAVDYKDTTRSISFKTSTKIVTDSAFNAIITYMKIPIVTAMITRDSVTVVNKRDKCYQKQTLSYIREMFGIDFSYRNVEELFLGRPLDYDVNQKYFVINNPYQYAVSTHKKKDKRRLDRKAKDDIIITYFLTPDGKNIRRTSVLSPSDSTEIIVDYTERELINTIRVPKKVEIEIKTPRNHMLVRLEYEKTEIDEPQELIIVIPDSYEKCDN